MTPPSKFETVVVSFRIEKRTLWEQTPTYKGPCFKINLVKRRITNSSSHFETNVKKWRSTTVGAWVGLQM